MKFAAVVAVSVNCVVAQGGPSDFPPKAPPFKFDETLPELPTPAVVNMDASWLRSLPQYSEWVDIKNIPRFHCDGAVIRRINIAKAGTYSGLLQFNLRFDVGLRKGDDKDITIDYNFLDGDRVVGSGRIDRQNLDEDQNTTFQVSIALAKTDFEKLLAAGAKPIFRLTMSIAEQE